MTPGRAQGHLYNALTSLAVGAALLALAAVIVAPTLEPVFMGSRYAELASVPVGELATYRLEGVRMLTPVVGRLLGFTGGAWMWFPLLIGVVFLAMTHRFLRAQGLAAWEAVAATALIAFATPITWTLAFPGYVDTTTYLLLLGSFVQIWRRSHTWAIFFALGPVNHEASVFLAPALLALAVFRSPAEQRVRTAGVWVALAALALVPALLVRAKLAQDLGAGAPSGLGAVFGRDLVRSLPTLLIGLFMGWKVTWLLPVVLGVVEHRAGGLRATWVVLVVLGCTLAQLLFASDTTRLMAPAFLAMVLCVVELHKHLAPRDFGLLLGGLLATNVAIPQAFAVPQGLVLCQPLPMALLMADQGRYDFRGVVFFEVPGLYQPGRQAPTPPQGGPSQGPGSQGGQFGAGR
ncbi:MAG: hypothetical protein V4850_06305 [Myxococcota bacterium]